MLYKLIAKWNRRYKYSIIVGLLYFAVLTILFMIIFDIVCKLHYPKYEEAYYFLISGWYIPAILFELADITISAIVLYIYERDLKEVIRKMRQLSIVVAISIVILLSSPINIKNFVMVLCDIPSIVSDNNYTIEAKELALKMKDEITKTRGRTYHKYHYYVMIEGKKYLMSKGLEKEEFERRVSGYLEDETNNQLKELNSGIYRITYLPISRCIIKIEFKQKS